MHVLRLFFDYGYIEKSDDQNYMIMKNGVQMRWSVQKSDFKNNNDNNNNRGLSLKNTEYRVGFYYRDVVFNSISIEKHTRERALTRRSAKLSATSLF